MGPTATGKSALAIALCRRFPFELVSVDSAQVFRDMDIGTAKPDAATRAAVAHHLIDLITPLEAYSAARFRNDALSAMKAISERNKVPLLVGGTMLYFKALLDGLADLPAADPALRRDLDRQATERGWPALHAQLAAVDPPTAARLQPGDAQRIQRALEVFQLSGRPLSALLADSRRQPVPYSLLTLGLLPAQRSDLHDRIGQRFDAMLAAGLVAEVEQLRDRYPLVAGMPALRCVGYRQVWDVLCGDAPASELRDRGVYATRQLAKRQITWMSNTLRPPTFDCNAADLLATVARAIDRFLR